MNTEYMPARLRAVKGLSLLDRDVLAELKALQAIAWAGEGDAAVLSDALCGVKVQHVEASVGKLRELGLLEVVLDASDERWLRVTAAGLAYWEPPEGRSAKQGHPPENNRKNCVTPYLLQAQEEVLTLIKEKSQTPAKPDQREAVRQRPHGEETAALDLLGAVVDTFGCQPSEEEGRAASSSAFDCGEGSRLARTDTLPMEGTQRQRCSETPGDGRQEATDKTACYPGPEDGPARTPGVHVGPGGMTFVERARDGPPALRHAKGHIARAVIKGVQGGYEPPADLWDRLPSQVVLSLVRGEPCIPMSADKRPLVKWKVYQDRLPAPYEIRQWLNRLDIYGWARVTGRISGVIVLDDDGGGWFEKWGLQPHLITRSGGFHWIGEWPGWRVKTLNSHACKELGEAFPLLDIRGDGGYSMISSQDEAYTWLKEGRPEPLDLLPPHVRRFFGLEKAPRPNEKARQWTETAQPGPQGRSTVEKLLTCAERLARASGRNCGGFWLACLCRNDGYSQGETLALYAAYASRVGGTDTRGRVAPYTEEEWEQSVRSAYSQAPR